MIRVLDRDAIGSRLTARMAEYGVAQKDLAARLHVDLGQISKLMHGRQERPSLELLWQLAQELEITLDYLVEGKGAPDLGEFVRDGGDCSPSAPDDYRTIARDLAAFVHKQATEVNAPIARAIERAQVNIADALAASHPHSARRGDTGAARAAQ